MNLSGHDFPFQSSDSQDFFAKPNIFFQMKKAFELTLKKGIIPVFAHQHIGENIIAKVEISKKFKDYISKIQNTPKDVEVDKIEILGVEMFGEKVGFVNLRAHTKKEGFPTPAYVFLRGPAVAILVLVNEKILLVQQYRTPVQQTLLEAPAGMLDESGDFAGTAALQIEQQTSIKIKHEDLYPLGVFYPSPGGCDEDIKMFYCKVEMSEQEMKAMQEKIHGKEGESQRIKIKLINFDPIKVLETKDAKLISLVFAYQNLVLKSQSSKL